MNHVYYNDTQYNDLAQKTQRLIEEADQLPESYSKEMVFTLLENFDMLHREALSRLLKIIEEKSPGLRDEMEADFAIQSLFTLYDLFEDGLVSRKAGPIQVDKLIPVASVSGGIENDPKIRMPVWIPAGNIIDLDPGQIYFKEFEGEKVLLSKVNNELFALQSICPGSSLSMEFGTIANGNLICPWHGCIYDLHTGIKAGDEMTKLKLYPVTVQGNGNFLVGFNI
jgi:nitrite reductase/ring-hydroxylating ferredoxin subunit